MKLSISNIGWDKSRDEEIYEKMISLGFEGLEIAPTRVFNENPYEDLNIVRKWHDDISLRFVIPSMQSIWYGRSESIFGDDEGREELIKYTKKAVVFARTIGCGNLVFGCPKNRNMPDGASEQTAVDFFKELGDFADENGTAIGIEATPPIYNTNFLNTTESALEFIRRVSSPGIKLNLDVGTMIQNNEDVSELEGSASLINHVHVSEPYLKKIAPRGLHSELFAFLKANGYERFVSIEMGKQDDLNKLFEAMEYVAEAAAD